MRRQRDELIGEVRSMTVNDLRTLAQRQPFEPFTIHMNDGSRLKVGQPDDMFLHKQWPFNALIMMDKGRWSIIYVRNIAHVSSRGDWPKMKGRKRRNEEGEE
jgi:hypothetical protein